MTVIEVAVAQSGWRAGLHQIAREVTLWTDPLLTLFFDKQRLRQELEDARDLDLSRRQGPTDHPREAPSPERPLEENWASDHWPVDPPTSRGELERTDAPPRAELPPQLDGWDNEGARTPWEDEWPTR